MDKLKVNYIKNSTNVGNLVYWYNNLNENTNKTILMINGFLSSSLNSSKVNYLLNYSKLNNLNFLVYDHFGHGSSDGSISDSNLDFGQFINDFKLIIKLLKNELKIRDVIVVGSSFANWLILYNLEYIQTQVNITGWVGIGSSWNFGSNWLDEITQLKLTNETVYNRPSSYSSTGYYSISINLIKSMIKYELKSNIKYSIKTYLIHGELDEDVPMCKFLKNLEFLQCSMVRIIIIEGGDHRLSSEESLKSLEFSLNQLLNT
jgi:pimeloyl-ACP methyl ester carboxylesterase